jgi:ABC-2 type transport system ATP-binding protein
VPDGLAAIPGVASVSVDGDRVRLEVTGYDVLPVLERAGIRSLTVAPPTLEELFLRYYDSRTEAASLR